jgi:putative salt-induced outer membrane protein YdiY
VSEPRADPDGRTNVHVCIAAAAKPAPRFLKETPRMPQRLAFLILLFALGAAHADEVILANGDRLTGTVVRKEAEELIFKTSYAGDIKIAWSQIVRVTTQDPMSLVLSDQSLAHAKTIGEVPKPKPSPTEAPATTGETDADTTRSAGPQPVEAPAEKPPAGTAETESAPIPIDAIAYINAGPGIDLLGVRWKGRINVGGNGNRGNSRTDNVRVEGEAVARQQQNRWTLSGVFDRGKDQGNVTRHNWRVSGKYDLFIGPRWYGYSILSLEADRFRDIDRRDTIGAGVGHQFIDTERTHLSLEGGLNYVRTDFEQAPDESYPALRWAVNYDQRLFGTEMQIFHNHEILSDITDFERTFVRSQTGLRLPLLHRLMATAQLNLDFDNKPAAGKVKSDRVYLFTVGYHW